MPISSLEFQMMRERVAANTRHDSLAKHSDVDRVMANACEQESKLHQQILDHCRQQWFPWLPLHSRIDRASTVAVGAADFVILLPNGKVVIAECKRKGSKATPAQLAFIAHCKKLGHIAGVVWSFEEFLQLVNQAKAAEKEKAEPANQAKI